MRRLLVACTSFLLLAGAARAEPQTFVYKGAGCTGAAALGSYESLIGRNVDGATDFLDYTSSWANLESETNWALGCWQGRVANLDVSVPMLVNNTDATGLAELAQGQFNAYFVQIAQSLVSHGFPNAYVRVGWEFNGNWYRWSSASSPTTWIKGYRKIVAAMRSVPGANFKFVWNPALYTQQLSPTQAYPGDAYVDVIATDAYNTDYDSGYTDPAQRWASVSGDAWGVKPLVNFANAHGKPYAFPEWGTGDKSDGHGGGDDPMFIANMAPIVQGSAFQSYWDYNAGDYNAQVSDGSRPAAAAAIMAAFGSVGAGSTSNSAVIQSIGAIVTAGAAPFTPSALNVSATGGEATAIQTSPKLYQVIVWTPGDVAATVEVSFGVKVKRITAYNPAMGTAAFQVLGGESTASFSLQAGQPLILTVKK